MYEAKEKKQNKKTFGKTMGGNRTLSSPLPGKTPVEHSGSNLASI
jgi:hypothetical protein